MSASAYELHDFVADLRTVLRQDAPEEERLEQAAAALRKLLANRNALVPYRWALELGRGPWVLHEDAQLGFVVTLLLKPRANSTPVHHHAEAWTLYGIFEGTETVHRYDRVDDRRRPDHADVRLVVDHVRQPGEVEIEPPFAIHNETTSRDHDTIAIAVRGRNLGTIQQEWFDLETGAVRAAPGNAGKPLPPRN
jgi:predicted metal-dependent enzyme (double-stranded beta helix superfamily)